MFYAQTAQWCGNAMNDRFMLEHNDSMKVWMFQASGIKLHTLEIIILIWKYNLLNKLTFTR